MTRKVANLEIMNELSEYLAQNPTMRFGQALRNIGIIVDVSNPEGAPKWTNHFYEESDDMLKRVLKEKKKR